MHGWDGKILFVDLIKGNIIKNPVRNNFLEKGGQR